MAGCCTGVAEPKAKTNPRVVLGGDASISIDVVELPDGRVKIAGATNLPKDMEFIVSVEEITPGFRGDSRCKVKADGSFLTETFGRANGLPAGQYAAIVTAPYSSLQPPDVQKVIGKKGESLSGPLVSKRDDWFGVSLMATKEFSIGGPQAAEKAQIRLEERFKGYQRMHDKIVALEKQLQVARNQKLQHDSKKWVSFAQEYAPELNAVQAELTKSEKAGPLLEGNVKISLTLSALEGMFLSTAFRESAKYEEAEKEYHTKIRELEMFLSAAQKD